MDKSRIRAIVRGIRKPITVAESDTEMVDLMRRCVARMDPRWVARTAIELRCSAFDTDRVGHVAKFMARRIGR